MHPIRDLDPEERARRDRIIREGVAAGDEGKDIAQAAGCSYGYVRDRLHRLGLYAEWRQARRRKLGHALRGPTPRRAAT
jgi:hypothetical protein